MNADLMQQYIEFGADRLLVALEYDRVHRVSNPFEFISRAVWNYELVG